VWFGFVSRFAFWLGARRAMDRAGWLQTTRGVPVLMYHGFTDSGERDRYVLSARAFARQMRLLRLLRRDAVGFDDIARRLREGGPLPRGAVVITIDDGYLDNFAIAYPILRRHGIVATIFLVSRRFDGVNDWDDEGAVAGRPTVSTREVGIMAADGIRFGAHTREHPRLPDLADAEVEGEIAGSRADLERDLGMPIATFAYPYGSLDDRAVAAVAAAGFSGACTTECRLARQGDDPLLVPRIEIKGEDSTLRFLRKLWFGGV
jgi:peptidoglycan/xylan/chitin deacetylase (PgdA/CDA1 family)